MPSSETRLHRSRQTCARHAARLGRRPGLLLMLLLSLSIGARAQADRMDGRSSAAAADTTALQAKIAALATNAEAEIAVAYRPLGSQDDHALFLRADEAFHAASTMKIPVMIELFRQADAGTIRLDDPITVTNRFSSIVDGSLFSLDATDDSDQGEIYRMIGKTMTARALCEAMITVSSNLATNILIEKLGVKNIQRTVADLDAEGVKVLRGVEDGKAFAQGLNNSTTARGLLRLLDAIAAGRAASPAASREMVEILKRQKFNDAIPAGLPRGIPVAHKTGTITKIHHDAAIVYAPHPFILVVLVRGLQDEAKSARLIAEISRTIYTHDTAIAGATR